MILVNGQKCNEYYKCNVGYDFKGMDYNKVDPVLCDSSSEMICGCYTEITQKGKAYGCAYKGFLDELNLKHDDYGKDLIDDEGKLFFKFCKGETCNKKDAKLTLTTANPTNKTTAAEFPDYTDPPHGQKLMTASARTLESKIEFFLLVAYLTFYFRF